MKKSFIRLLKLGITSGGLITGLVVADEIPTTMSAEKEPSEQSKEKAAVKSRKKGGRVIEYGGQATSSNGVVPAVGQSDPVKKNAKKTSDNKEQNINQKNSVKLITGGDPSDGNAKSGHLPVLD